MDKMAAAGASVGPPVSDFRPLHKYLAGRFADTVVLTFAQIEDVLGQALPAAACAEQAWWATASDSPSAQSRAWSQAHRTATANIPARTVTFVRE